MPTKNPGEILLDAGQYALPVWGTVKSVQDAINEPSLQNIGMAVLSGATDLASLIGIGLLGRAAFGAGKAGKVAKGALKTYEAAQKATSKAYGNYFVKSAATNAALNSNLQGAEAFQNFVRAAKAENKAASQIPILEKSLQQSFFTNERA